MLRVREAINDNSVELAEQIKSDPTITIVSEQDIVLQSGQPGTRLEVESMGILAQRVRGEQEPC